MKTNLSALVTLSLLSLLGCGNAVSTAPSEARAVDTCVSAEGRAGAHVYVFSSGSTAPARVERTIRSDGSETLLGVTALRQNKMIESVEIGPDGRLVYADVSLKGPSGVSRRLIVDAQHGVSYSQDELGSGWKRLSVTDAPLAYAAFSEGGDELALAPTPVSAWVVLRALSASPNVALVDSMYRKATVVPGDQLVVTDGDERLVVAGDSVLAANDEFVTSLGDATAEPLRLASLSLRPHITASR